MKFLSWLRTVKKSLSPYSPSIEIFISKNSLIHNLCTYISSYPKISFAPVLKSNAYGHGLVPVARVLDGENVPFFVVDSLYEAMLLRGEDIKSKILIVGYASPENINSSSLSNVSFTITSIEQLKSLAETARSPKVVHLKIDTGMHRQGISENDINEAIKIIKGQTLLTLEGLCSHFADADGEKDTFTNKQLVKWEESVRCFKKEFEDIRFFHISATAGVRFAPESTNVARLGLGLYGISSKHSGDLPLKPVLEMRSLITSVKTILPGEHVGYNCTYKTEKQTSVATIPAGYFEGIDRRLSDRGFVSLKGIMCPIIGRVSMNISSIDVSEVPDAKISDSVIIISRCRENKNSVESMAKLSETISHEILVHIAPHLRRTVCN